METQNDDLHTKFKQVKTRISKQYEKDSLSFFCEFCHCFNSEESNYQTLIGIATKTNTTYKQLSDQQVYHIEGKCVCCNAPRTRYWKCQDPIVERELRAQIRSMRGKKKNMRKRKRIFNKHCGHWNDSRQNVCCNCSEIRLVSTLYYRDSLIKNRADQKHLLSANNYNDACSNRHGGVL